MGGKARRSRRKHLARLSRCSAFNLAYVTWLPKRKSRHYQNEISKILRRKSKLQARYIPARFNVFFCACECVCARVCVCKRATLESENRVQLQNSCSIPVRLTGTGRCSWKWISNHIWVPATVAALCLRPASVQYSVPVVDLSIRHKRTYISRIRSAADRAKTTTTTTIMEAEEITKLVDGVYRVSLWSLSLYAFSAVLVSSSLRGNKEIQMDFFMALR